MDVANHGPAFSNTAPDAVVVDGVALSPEKRLKPLKPENIKMNDQITYGNHTITGGVNRATATPETGLVVIDKLKMPRQIADDMGLLPLPEAQQGSHEPRAATATIRAALANHKEAPATSRAVLLGNRFRTKPSTVSQTKLGWTALWTQKPNLYWTQRCCMTWGYYERYCGTVEHWRPVQNTLDRLQLATGSTLTY